MKNSKTKKLLSILLAVMMVVGMIPATAIPASAANSATIATEYDHLVNELVIDGEETIIVTPIDGGHEISGLKEKSDIHTDHLAEVDEIAIELYEANLALEEINAEQDEAIIEIYEIMEAANNG